MSRDLIFSARKKDFRIDWFTGQGAGGQKRNKTALCCRITHKETGLSAVGTKHTSRTKNQEDAFRTLTDKLLEKVLAEEDAKQERPKQVKVIRTYHYERGTVKDHRTKVIRPLKKTLNGDLTPFIEANWRIHMKDDELEEETNG